MRIHIVGIAAIGLTELALAGIQSGPDGDGG